MRSRPRCPPTTGPCIRRPERGARTTHGETASALPAMFVCRKLAPTGEFPYGGAVHGRMAAPEESHATVETIDHGWLKMELRSADEEHDAARCGAREPHPHRAPDPRAP